MPNNRCILTVSDQICHKSLIRYRVKLCTDAYAKHWQQVWQFELVAVGAWVILLATVGGARFMLAWSSGSGIFGTSSGAGTIGKFPFSLRRSDALFEIPFGTDGS